MVKPENPRNYEGEYFLFCDLPLCVLQDYITDEVHEEWKFYAVKVKEESITTVGGTPGHFSKTNDGWVFYGENSVQFTYNKLPAKGFLFSIRELGPKPNRIDWVNTNVETDEQKDFSAAKGAVLYDTFAKCYVEVANFSWEVRDSVTPYLEVKNIEGDVSPRWSAAHHFVATYEDLTKKPIENNQLFRELLRKLTIVDLVAEPHEQDIDGDYTMPDTWDLVSMLTHCNNECRPWK